MSKVKFVRVNDDMKIEFNANVLRGFKFTDAGSLNIADNGESTIALGYMTLQNGKCSLMVAYMPIDGYAVSLTKTFRMPEEADDFRRELQRRLNKLLREVMGDDLNNYKLLHELGAKKSKKGKEVKVNKLEVAEDPEKVQPDTERNGEVWTIDDSERATDHGWNLFEANGRWMIMPDDDDDKPLTSNETALQYVKDRAAEGSELHQKALRLTGTKA